MALTTTKPLLPGVAPGNIVGDWVWDGFDWQRMPVSDLPGLPAGAQQPRGFTAMQSTTLPPPVTRQAGEYAAFLEKYFFARVESFRPGHEREDGWKTMLDGRAFYERMCIEIKKFEVQENKKYAEATQAQAMEQLARDMADMSRQLGKASTQSLRSPPPVQRVYDPHTKDYYSIPIPPGEFTVTGRRK